MKNLFFCLFITALTFSCTEERGFRIAGTVGDAALNGQYVYLYEYGANELRDSALITDGKFAFKGVQDEAVIAFISPSPDARPGTTFPPNALWLLLDNSKLNVSIAEASTVNGSAENDDLTAYMNQLAAIYSAEAEIEKMMASKNDSIINIAEAMYEKLDEQAIPVHKAYISRHGNSLLGAMTLYANRYTLSENDQRELLSTAGETFRQWPGIVKLSEHLNILEKVAIGKKFTDFEMPDPAGKPHKLSEYAGNGKVVLVDFWASWCGPCRRSMPHLREVYAQYKGKGFEIVGVSFDRTHEAWKQGIADLQLPWPQISDVKYWQSAAAGLYGVNSIPHTILMDGEGTIIAKNLHGKALDDKLAQLLQ
jgi:peroxiredoxin